MPAYFDRHQKVKNVQKIVGFK